MPKVSHDQALAEMEGALELARSNADLLPPLALEVADELAGHIAEFKAAWLQQRALLAERIVTTEALTSIIARGNLAARHLRSFVVLALGTKHPRLSQFGIGIRGRRRRKPRKAAAPATAPSASDT